MAESSEYDVALVSFPPLLQSAIVIFIALGSLLVLIPRVSFIVNFEFLQFSFYLFHLSLRIRPLFSFVIVGFVISVKNFVVETNFQFFQSEGFSLMNSIKNGLCLRALLVSVFCCVFVASHVYLQINQF